MADLFNALSQSSIQTIKLPLQWLRNVPECGASKMGEALFRYKLASRIEATDMKEGYTLAIVARMQDLYAGSSEAINANCSTTQEIDTQRAVVSPQQLEQEQTLKQSYFTRLDDKCDDQDFARAKIAYINKVANSLLDEQTYETQNQEALHVPKVFNNSPVPVTALFTSSSGNNRFFPGPSLVIPVPEEKDTAAQGNHGNLEFTRIHALYFGDSEDNAGIFRDYLKDRARSYWFKDFCSSVLAFLLHCCGYQTDANCRKKYIDRLETTSKCYLENPELSNKQQLNALIEDGIENLHPRLEYKNSLRSRLEIYKSKVNGLPSNECQHSETASLAIADNVT